MFGLGLGELLVVMVIGLVLFGNRLPNMARSLGKTLTEFRKEVRGPGDDSGPLLR